MKDRLKKKVEKRNRKLIHKFLDAVLDINGLSPRQQEFTGNKPTVFLNYFGHIASIEARVHRSGWEARQNSDYIVSAHSDNPRELTEAVSRLKAETPAARTARGSE